MSGTHDILAAERAAAAANKQSNQDIWQADGQTHASTITTDTAIDKDTSGSRYTGRTTAQDALSGSASSDIHADPTGQFGLGQSS